MSLATYKPRSGVIPATLLVNGSDHFCFSRNLPTCYFFATRSRFYTDSAVFQSGYIHFLDLGLNHFRDKKSGAFVTR